MLQLLVNDASCSADCSGVCSLQGSQCISLAVHPGMVLTQLGRYLVSPGSLWSYILLILVWPFSKSVPQVSFAPWPK